MAESNRKIIKLILLWIITYAIAGILAWIAQGMLRPVTSLSDKEFIIGSLFVFLAIGALLIFPVRAVIYVVSLFTKKK